MSDDAEHSPRLLKSTAVTGSMTFLSRILGLVRDKVFSFYFGSGPVMDAFIVAFKIPNILRRFFAEGAFSQAFVPVLSEHKTRGSTEDVRELVAKTAGTLGLALFLITVIGVVAAPLIISVAALGFDAEDGRRAMAIDMLRLTFPYIFFVSLTALAGAVLNTYRRFAVPAFTPVLLNVVLIVFAAWLAPGSARPDLVLAAGVFTAGAVQLLFQLPFIARLDVLTMPRWSWRDSEVRRIIRLMLPIMFGSSAAQINILFDTVLATLLASGSVTWLYYSDRLVEFPLGVFGIAVATVILPALSVRHTQNSPEQFAKMLDWALRLVVLIAVPAAVGLAMLAEPMIATIFFGGAFVANDVEMAGWSLRAFAPGLIGFILVKVLAPGFYARHDTRTPVKIAVRALLLGMVLNVVFVVTLLRTGWAPAHTGLAAATSLSALFNSGMLLTSLIAGGILTLGPGWARLLVQVSAATGAMAICIQLLVDRYGDWLAMTIWERVGALSICVFGSMIVYFLACAVVGIRLNRFISQKG